MAASAGGSSSTLGPVDAMCENPMPQNVWRKPHGNLQEHDLFSEVNPEWPTEVAGLCAKRRNMDSSKKDLDALGRLCSNSQVEPHIRDAVQSALLARQQVRHLKRQVAAKREQASNLKESAVRTSTEVRTRLKKREMDRDALTVSHVKEALCAKRCAARKEVSDASDLVQEVEDIERIPATSKVLSADDDGCNPNESWNKTRTKRRVKLEKKVEQMVRKLGHKDGEDCRSVMAVVEKVQRIGEEAGSERRKAEELEAQAKEAELWRLEANADTKKTDELLNRFYEAQRDVTKMLGEARNSVKVETDELHRKLLEVLDMFKSLQDKTVRMLWLTAAEEKLNEEKPRLERSCAEVRDASCAWFKECDEAEKLAMEHVRLIEQDVAEAKHECDVSAKGLSQEVAVTILEVRKLAEMQADRHRTDLDETLPEHHQRILGRIENHSKRCANGGDGLLFQISKLKQSAHVADEIMKELKVRLKAAEELRDEAAGQWEAFRRVAGAAHLVDEESAREEAEKSAEDAYRWYRPWPVPELDPEEHHDQATNPNCGVVSTLPVSQQEEFVKSLAQEMTKANMQECFRLKQKEAELLRREEEVQRKQVALALQPRALPASPEATQSASGPEPAAEFLEATQSASGPEPAAESLEDWALVTTTAGTVLKKEEAEMALWPGARPMAKNDQPEPKIREDGESSSPSRAAAGRQGPRPSASTPRGSATGDAKPQAKKRSTISALQDALLPLL